MKKNLLLSLVSLLVFLLLAEGALRLVNHPKALEVGWRWDQSPYRAPFNNDNGQVNQLGLRGHPIEYGEKDFVVVLLGDSQVEAGTQTFDKMPEVLLRDALQRATGKDNIRVFSVASAGWGNDQQLVWLREYFRHHRADLVVNWLTPVNDYWENAFIDRGVTEVAGRLKPTFRLADDGSLADALPALGWKLKNLAVLGAAGALRGKDYTLEQFYLNRYQKSLPAPAVQAVAASACPAEVVPQSTLIGSFLAGKRAFTVSTDEDVVHGRSHYSPFLRETSARDAYAIRLTHRLLEEVASTAASHGAQYLIYHPYRDDLDGAFREIRCIRTWDGQFLPYDGSDWLRHLKASPAAKWLLTDTISSAEPLASGPNDWHFNALGNRLAMDALARQLAPRIAPAAGPAAVQ